MQLSRRATAGADGGETRILRSMSCRFAPGGCLFFDYMTDDHDTVRPETGATTYALRLTFVSYAKTH
ncbi:hypothetical protein N7527_009054 [Penicillium freii]|nr:hypothetical protein N7527_009054 [Penicillium freii]